MEREEAVLAFDQALTRLRDVLAEPPSTLVRDAAIKRFEFTFELAWKAAQRVLRDEAIVGRSPKECLREAFGLGLIEDNPLWVRMIEDRNLTVHTYQERTARRIFQNLPEYYPQFEEPLKGLPRKTAARSSINQRVDPLYSPCFLS